MGGLIHPVSLPKTPLWFWRLNGDVVLWWEVLIGWCPETGSELKLLFALEALGLLTLH